VPEENVEEETHFEEVDKVEVLAFTHLQPGDQTVHVQIQVDRLILDGFHHLCRSQSALGDRSAHRIEQAELTGDLVE